MITRLWAMIGLLIMLAVLPVTYLQVRMSRESIELLFDLVKNIPLEKTLELNLRHIKEIAKIDEENESAYRETFKYTAIAKRELEDFHLLKEGISDDLQNQSLRNAILILILSLLASLLLSFMIVKAFKNILSQKSKAIKDLEQLASLERWQHAARVLMHELKSPITPIKIVATDIEAKYTTLEPKEFGEYLSISQNLVRDQLDRQLHLIQKFAKFGTLPDVATTLCNIPELLKNFASYYFSDLENNANLEIDLSEIDDLSIYLDKKLMNDLLYNLLKNAIEANPNTKINARISPYVEKGYFYLRVENDGQKIPDDIEEHIFEPYVSGGSKPKDAFCMGLGLSICRKIALDHSGDLRLVDNQEGKVAFECFIPIRKS